jgi:hypothetical protein
MVLFVSPTMLKNHFFIDKTSNIWNALGAIGQWVSAIATFIAIWIALQQNRSKIDIVLNKIPPFYPSLSSFSIRFIAINKSAIPIT